MGAKAVKLNPKTGQRIKILLKEHKKTQRWLAEQLDITPVNLSYIVSNRRGLTLERGQLIASLFPDTRVEWIMGEDDFRTVQEKENEETLKILELIANEMSAFESLARRLGYSFEFNQELYTKEGNDPGYVSIFQHEILVATCSLNDFIEIKAEIKDFAAFKMAKLIRLGVQKRLEES